MVKQVAVYVRISSDPRAEGLGVARQEADCRALCARLGWAVAGLYCDNDTSAFSGQPRAAYGRMLADVRAGRVDGVVAYAPDRLYRRLPDLAEFIETVKTAGTAVRTVAAGEIDLSTAAGRQTAGLLGVVAAGESDRQGERIRRKLAANAEEGKPHGGHRPYAWEADRITERPEEVAIVREATERVLNGETIRGVTRDLNARGVPNTRGNPWTHATLLGVIRRPRNAGIRVHQGKETGGACAWKPIIEPATYRALVRLLDNPARVTTPGRGGRLHLLSGLARCGVCGGPLRVARSNGGAGKPGYDTYRCTPAGHVSRSREHLDELVSEIVARRLAQADAVDLLRPHDDGAWRVAAQAAEGVRRRLDDAAALFAAGTIDGRQLGTITADLRPDLERLEREAAPPPDRSRLFGDLIGAESVEVVRERWDALGPDRRRAVVEALLTIRVDRAPRGRGFRTDGIVIDWRVG